MEKKTLLQKDLEILVTKGRGHEKIPYIKFLGQKISLQNWLLFSKIRLIKSYNTNKEEKIPISIYFKKIIKENKEKYEKIFSAFLRYKNIAPESLIYSNSFIREKYSNFKK